MTNTIVTAMTEIPIEVTIIETIIITVRGHHKSMIGIMIHIKIIISINLNHTRAGEIT